MTAVPARQRADILQAIGRGEVAAALAALRPLVDGSDDPEDHLLLGRLAWLAIANEEASEHLERAYRDFQSRGLPRRAAMAATALGRLYFDGLENQVVGRGWFTRALRVLEREPPCVEEG